MKKGLVLFNQTILPELGTTRDSINTEILKKFPITMPPKQEQDRNVSIRGAVDNKITELESKKKSLESLKKELVQKLLTDQVRVSV